MDIIFTVDRFPNEGETLHAQAFSVLPGGKGANQAVACANFGVPTIMIGSVGDDSFGEQSLRGLLQAKVSVDNIQVKKNFSTGIACILINNGDNRIILNEGANMMTSVDDSLDVLTKAGTGHVLLTQLEVPTQTVVESILEAKERDFFTILNPAPAKTIPEKILSHVDLIIPNEIEAEMLTGYDVKDPYFDRRVVDYFTEKGVKEVVITKGANGAIYGNAKELFSVKVFPIDVVDTTGAGDTFVGAIATEVAKGKKVKDALVFASAAAALTISRLGAQNAIPKLEDVEQFIKRKQGH